MSYYKDERSINHIPYYTECHGKIFYPPLAKAEKNVTALPLQFDQLFSLCDPEAALLSADPGHHGGVVLGVVEKVPDEDVQRRDGHLQINKVSVNQIYVY